MSDPRTFLATYPPPVIFDEVQYAPDLLPYIKEKIDADRHTSGQFLLTGSQNLSLAEQVTESLAGRAAMLRLLPLSRREAAAKAAAYSALGIRAPVVRAHFPCVRRVVERVPTRRIPGACHTARSRHPPVA